MIARKSVLLGAVILSSVSSLPAQQAPCSTRTLLVNVIDQEGKPAQVSADSFRAKYHGHSVDILSVTSVAASRRIVLLLDATGSMQDGLKWEAEQLLARDIVQGPPDSSFALMIFGSDIEDKIGFAQGPVALAKKLNDLPSELQAIPKGERKTALYDAILAALNELTPPREGDTIYVITDGEDNRSTNKPSQVEPRLLAVGVRPFAFLFEPPQCVGEPLRESALRTWRSWSGILALHAILSKSPACRRIDSPTGIWQQFWSWHASFIQ